MPAFSRLTFFQWILFCGSRTTWDEQHRRQNSIYTNEWNGGRTVLKNLIPVIYLREQRRIVSRCSDTLQLAFLSICATGRSRVSAPFLEENAEFSSLVILKLATITITIEKLLRLNGGLIVLDWSIFSYSERAMKGFISKIVFCLPIFILCCVRSWELTLQRYSESKVFTRVNSWIILDL